jgi:hypothetical protein
MALCGLQHWLDAVSTSSVIDGCLETHPDPQLWVVACLHKRPVGVVWHPRGLAVCVNTRHDRPPVRCSAQRLCVCVCVCVCVCACVCVMQCYTARYKALFRRCARAWGGDEWIGRMRVCAFGSCASARCVE